jgi:lipopolysaccharide transport system ATP-binding protein
MNDEIALKVEKLSKQYRLGLVGTGTISHDINRWWHKIRGKEDPYSMIGDTNDRSTIGDSEYVWALKDINFELKRGEILGVIGKNGAGKSTLLKILSKVTGPSTGKITMKGRVASLLEVGTGMHPELTGRENIYLNGAILGMTHAEVSRKIDEIIDFSGCIKYIDTPVKRYSSGMRVRLGFAVAAFLEPEILIVDEVLAVGDAEFQKKAIGKMKDISSGEGRTVLFVSHNMGSIKRLCTRCIMLKNGEVVLDGNTEEVVNKYLASSVYKDDETSLKSKLENFDFKKVKITDIEVFNATDKNLPIRAQDDLIISIDYQTLESVPSPAFVVSVKDEDENEIFRLSNMPISGFRIENLGDKGQVNLRINNLPLTKGTYLIDVGFVHENIEWFFNLKNIIKLEVVSCTPYMSKFELDSSRGYIWVDHEWTLIQNN